jgi:hypothetical protein
MVISIVKKGTQHTMNYFISGAAGKIENNQVEPHQYNKFLQTNEEGYLILNVKFDEFNVKIMNKLNQVTYEFNQKK